MSEKQKKSVFRKILESIGYVMGIFACTVVGGAFVRWAGGDDHYVLVIGGLTIATTLTEIWGSEHIKERWGLLTRCAKYKKQKKQIKKSINDVMTRTRSCKDCGRGIDESERALVVDGELICSECEQKLPRSEDE